MVKTFRKLAALTAAVALVSSFAVCASAAVTVNMTTSYIDGSKIAVRAVVSDGEGNELDGAQVTYYATHDGAVGSATDGVVYMDQKPAENGSATFEFETAAAYITSAVKVGYTNADAAVGDLEIPDYTQFALTVTNGAGNSASTPIIAGKPLSGTYTVAYTPTAGKYVSALTVAGGTAAITATSDSSLTITLTMDGNVTGDVTITATELADATNNEAGSVINAGGIISDGKSAKIESGDASEYEGFKAQAGDRKLTVIGKVTGLAEGAKYGVIVTAETIDATATTLPDAGCYEALGKNGDGYFAVQLIDNHEDVATATFLVPGPTYHTAVYYQVGSEYKIVLGRDVVIEPAQ